MHNTHTNTYIYTCIPENTNYNNITCSMNISSKMSASIIGNIFKKYVLQINFHYDIISVINANLITFRPLSSYLQGETGQLSILLNIGNNG